jgi:non-specific serine/threonine protein kinase
MHAALHAEQAYLFRHALLRDAAYQLQLPSARGALHHLAFEILRSLQGIPEAELAAELVEHANSALEHLPPRDANADLRRQRLGLLELAGDHAEAGFHHEVALRYFRLLAAEGAASPSARLRAASRAAGIMILQGRTREASGSLETQIAHATQCVTPGELGAARCRLASAYKKQSMNDRALEELEMALVLARQAKDRTLEVEVLESIGSIHMQRDSLAKARGVLEEARRLAEQSGDRRSIASSLSGCGTLEIDAGHLAVGLGLLRRAESLAREINDAPMQATLLCHIGHALWWEGKTHDALECYERGLALHTAHGDVMAMTVAISSRANVLKELGQRNAALRDYREAEAMARETGNYHLLAVTLNNMAQVLTELQDLGAAESAICEAEQVARRSGGQKILAAVLYTRAGLADDAGRLDEADDLYAQAAAIQRELGLSGYLAYTLGDWSEVRRKQGRLEAALALADECMAFARELGDKPCQAAYARKRALGLSALGREAEAIAQLREGVRLLEETCQAPSPEYFRAVAQLARDLDAGGRSDEAERTTQAGLARASALEAAALANDPALAQSVAELRALTR